MTQQELLRIYSMYLPYGLKVTDINRVKPHRLADVRNDYTALLYFESKPCRWKLEELRPYLIPLSDLTKEIEHEGERFVPLDELTNGETVRFNFNDYAEDWNEKTYIDFERYVEEWISGEIYHLDFLPFGFIQKLVEWHFDIENLIGKGLAVNKNDIK